MEAFMQKQVPESQKHQINSNCTLTAEKSFSTFLSPGFNKSIQSKPLSLYGGGNPGRIQSKPEVSQPGDPYEQEAGRETDKIMRMPAPSVSPIEFSKIPTFPDQVQRKCSNSCYQKQLLDYSGSSTDSLQQLQRIRSSQAVRYPLKSGTLQAKLRIGQPNDVYEQEADLVAEQVMRIPNVPLNTGSPLIQRRCPVCRDDKRDENLQAKETSGKISEIAPHVEENISSMRGGGQPLSESVRSFFEPRFGHDFNQVRIHTGANAAESARVMNAHAYTFGRDVVFGLGKYQPESAEGKRMLAHELTHVVQQGAALSIQHPSANENSERHIQRNEVHLDMANHVVQRWPGDGMMAPGDCSWGKYLILRGSVETAKAIVSTLGSCSRGDNCLTLAAKIAAITAEIAARVAMAATCFKGGDTGHRQQIQDKVNMMNRCYSFFSGSSCPPALIAAMAVVVESAREVIAAAAAVVAIAAVVVLIAAIIELAELIAALVATAASAAAFATAAAAVILLLMQINDELSSEGSLST